MNKQLVIDQLLQKFPEKKIICLPDDNPAEILCEIEPSIEHGEYSVAIAIIDVSAQHVHKIATEVYEVIKGELKLFKDGKEFALREGDSITISPGEVHYALGNETWIKTTSHPGWMPEDHILI